MRTAEIMAVGLFFWLGFVALTIHASHKEKKYVKRRRMAELWRWYDETYHASSDKQHPQSTKTNEQGPTT